MQLPHFIEVDIKPDLYFGNVCWLNAHFHSGMKQIERYLANVARFQELYGD